VTTTTLDDEEPQRFSDYQAGWMPPWMDESGRDWATAFGLLKDVVRSGARNAVAAGRIGDAPDDALPFAGADSQIEQTPGETLVNYSARLQKRWQAWAESGSDAGPIDQLAVMGLTVRAKRNNQWDWDGHPGNVAPYWARMWLIVDQPNPFLSIPKCGDGHVCGGGQLCGLAGATSDHLWQLLRLARKWTSSHVLLVNVIAVVSGRLCGDAGGACGDGYVCGGDAVYFDGV
jgi:hypothetical protein